MDENTAYINAFMDDFSLANPGEKLFGQAVRTALEAVTPYILDHPSVEDQNIMQRLCEPELSASFRVCWLDDEGEVMVNRGYYVRMNGALGKCRGRLRFTSSVNADTIKALAFVQTFQNALSDSPAGGCAAGADFSPKGKSDTEVMNFCQSFMTELQKYAGCFVPVGDMGVGERESGFIFGQLRRLRGDVPCISLPMEESACVVPSDLAGKTVAVSGSGKVAQYAVSKAIEAGARVVTMSDSEGFIYDRAGIDAERLAYLAEIKNVFHGSVKRYVEKYPQAEYFAGGRPWSVKCDAALACACENELDGDDAKKLLKNGCGCVAELSVISTTPEARSAFASAGIQYFPSVIAGERAVTAFKLIADAMLLQGLV